MASDTHVNIVEQVIGYSFRTKAYLVQALTAAGVDEHNHDGNRKLGQLGEALTGLFLLNDAFRAEASRGKVKE